jgi:hypothetical protein
MDKKTNFNAWYVMIAVAGMLLLQAVFQQARQTEYLPYSQFKKYLEERKVGELLITETRITGTIKEPAAGEPGNFVTTRVDPAFAQELEKYGVEFRGGSDENFFTTLLSWVLPALLFFGLWFFLLRRMAAGGMGAGIGTPSFPLMMTPSLPGTRPVTKLHQPPPKVDSVPHSTSAWAMNGLIHARGVGVRIPSGPGRRFPLLSKDPIACQKTSRKTVPASGAHTVIRVRRDGHRRTCHISPTVSATTRPIIGVRRAERNVPTFNRSASGSAHQLRMTMKRAYRKRLAATVNQP